MSSARRSTYNGFADFPCSAATTSSQVPISRPEFAGGPTRSCCGTVSSRLPFTPFACAELTSAVTVQTEPLATLPSSTLPMEALVAMEPGSPLRPSVPLCRLAREAKEIQSAVTRHGAACSAGDEISLKLARQTSCTAQSDSYSHAPRLAHPPLGTHPRHTPVSAASEE